MRYYPAYTVFKEDGLPQHPPYIFRCIQKSTGRVFDPDTLEDSCQTTEVFYKFHKKESLLIHEVIFKDPKCNLDDSEREELPDPLDTVVSIETGKLNYQGNPIYWGDVYGIRWYKKDVFAYVDYHESVPCFAVVDSQGIVYIPFSDMGLEDTALFSVKDILPLGNIYVSQEKLLNHAIFLGLNIEYWPKWLRRENV